MGIEFGPLWTTLAEKGMKKGDLQEKAGLSSSTIAKLGKNERVSLEVIEKIGTALETSIEQIMILS